MGVRTLLLLAKLLFVSLASPDDAPPGGQAFIFLGHVGKPVIDEHLLLDAVAIYTRDLGIALLQSPGKQPASLSPSSVDDVVAVLRVRGARLGFWCQPAAGRKQLELVTIDPRRTVARYPFDPDGPSKSDLYRSIALRLRAILVGAESGEAAASSPAKGALPLAPPAPASAFPPAPSRPEKTPQAPPALPASSEGEPAGAFRPGRPGSGTLSDGASRLFFGAGYALSYPLGTTGSATARNALALDVMVATHAHLEWDLGTDLAPAVDRTSALATISVLDIPVRFGGRWLRQVGLFTVGAGPFVGVHWLSASASAGTMTDQRTAFGGAVGADIMARGPILAGFAPQLRVWAEVNAPRTRFIIQGVPRYDVGAVRMGLNLEVVAPVR